jgi:hypothetical protein
VKAQRWKLIAVWTLTAIVWLLALIAKLLGAGSKAAHGYGPRSDA